MADSSDPSRSGYYSAPIATFLSEDEARVLGLVVTSHSRDVDAEQRRAWEEEIAILKRSLVGIEGWVYLEFDVPRLGSRIDAVVICGPAIFPIEFKCGQDHYRNADRNQVWDYALDLKNFHLLSHTAPILPVLVPTVASYSEDKWHSPHPDGVRPPRGCRPEDLAVVLREGLSSVSGPPIDGEHWGASPYHPTPTIIEAARALYARHTVDAISRNDAGAKNLRVTSAAVEEVIDLSQSTRHKSVVFVTGVPGAGKTLVGLNIATRRRNRGDARAVFLSGNGPLVTVLQEALTRDELSRLGRHVRKGEIRQKVKPFIQNVHHFRDDGLRTTKPPLDRVVIFDEAQRAWNREKTADFMKRRKKTAGFKESESEFLLAYLDRHDDWAVVICLVGGGQEIYTGEAGIGAWLDAIHTRFRDWRLYISPDLTGSEYASGHALDAFDGDSRVTRDSRFHLSTSMRSFRSEKVSAFVKALLDCDAGEARELLRVILPRYPIAITRDLARAKRWVREQARGSERFGLVASSSAQRLKPHGLEDPATEFQIQGLELDWICVSWDADLRLEDDRWRYHAFRGDAWTKVHNEDRKRYLLNAYRVLLTRARQGMVVFVPLGEDSDPTRAPHFYDETYRYLVEMGMTQL
jgi:hypothetical protein